MSYAIQDHDYGIRAENIYEDNLMGGEMMRTKCMRFYKKKPEEVRG